MLKFIDKLLHPHRPEGPRVTKEQMEGVILQAQLQDMANRRIMRQGQARKAQAA